MKLVTAAALVVLGCASTQGASTTRQGSAGSAGEQRPAGTQGSSSGLVACQGDLDCPTGACVENYCRKY